MISPTRSNVGCGLSLQDSFFSCGWQAVAEMNPVELVAFVARTWHVWAY